MKTFTIIIATLLTIGSINHTWMITKLYAVITYNISEIESIGARQRVQKLRNDDLEERIKILESKR